MPTLLLVGTAQCARGLPFGHDEDLLVGHSGAGSMRDWASHHETATAAQVIRPTDPWNGDQHRLVRLEQERRGGVGT